MNRAYEDAAQEALAVMEAAYTREQAARAEVFPAAGEKDGSTSDKKVSPPVRENRAATADAGEIPLMGENAQVPVSAKILPHEGENAQAPASAKILPHEGENAQAPVSAEVSPHEEENEVYPEEVEAAEDMDAYVTDRALEELGNRFPQMDLTELAQNPLFIRFAAGEGRDFREICENFDAFIDQARALVRSAALPDRRTSAAPPVRRIPLSHVQRRELAAWNVANPAYRMSEADYFKRLRG